MDISIWPKTAVTAALFTAAAPSVTSAHSGHDHAGSALGGWTGPDGIAVLGVLLAAGLGFWLMNREERGSSRQSHLTRVTASSQSVSGAARTSQSVAPHSDGQTPTPLVANRRLRPPEYSRPRNERENHLS